MPEIDLNMVLVIIQALVVGLRVCLGFTFFGLGFRMAWGIHGDIRVQIEMSLHLIAWVPLRRVLVC